MSYAALARSLILGGRANRDDGYRTKAAIKKETVVRLPGRERTVFSRVGGGAAVGRMGRLGLRNRP